MKGSAVILLLILSSFAFGQPKEAAFSKEESRTDISGLIPVDTIALSDITGDYSGPRGGGEFVPSGRWEFTLNADRTLKSLEGCVAPGLTERGSWSVKKNKLQLQVEQRTISLDILKWSNFYFFIFPAQHENFIGDLHSLKEIAEKVKPLVVDDYMIAQCLSTKYFSKEIKLILSEVVLPTINRD